MTIPQEPEKPETEETKENAMHWIEFRKTWQGTTDPETEAAAAPPERVAWLRRRIAWRDFLETAVALLLAPFFAWFGWLSWTREQWPAFGFSALLVAAVIYIPWRLWRERRKLPKADPRRPVKDYLRAERDAMRAQAELLESVWWWYLSPLAVGVIGLYVSIRGLVWQSLAYAAVVLAMYLAIGTANRVAARAQFRTAVGEIDEQLAQLENGTREG